MTIPRTRRYPRRPAAHPARSVHLTGYIRDFALRTDSRAVDFGGYTAHIAGPRWFEFEFTSTGAQSLPLWTGEVLHGKVRIAITEAE